MACTDTHNHVGPFLLSRVPYLKPFKNGNFLKFCHTTSKNSLKPTLGFSFRGKSAAANLQRPTRNSIRVVISCQQYSDGGGGGDASKETAKNHCLDLSTTLPSAQPYDIGDIDGKSKESAVGGDGEMLGDELELRERPFSAATEKVLSKQLGVDILDASLTDLFFSDCAVPWIQESAVGGDSEMREKLIRAATEKLTRLKQLGVDILNAANQLMTAFAKIASSPDLSFPNSVAVLQIQGSEPSGMYPPYTGYNELNEVLMTDLVYSKRVQDIARICQLYLLATPMWAQKYGGYYEDVMITGGGGSIGVVNVLRDTIVDYCGTRIISGIDSAMKGFQHNARVGQYCMLATPMSAKKYGGYYKGVMPGGGGSIFDVLQDILVNDGGIISGIDSAVKGLQHIARVGLCCILVSHNQVHQQEAKYNPNTGSNGLAGSIAAALPGQDKVLISFGGSNHGGILLQKLEVAGAEVYTHVKNSYPHLLQICAFAVRFVAENPQFEATIRHIIPAPHFEAVKRVLSFFMVMNLLAKFINGVQQIKKT